MNENDHMEKYFEDLIKSITNIPKSKINLIIQILFDAWKNNNTIFLIANGGSASTATHFSCDLSKDTIVGNKKRYKTMSLVDNIPLVSSWTNDSGFNSIFTEQLKPWLEARDVIIIFSVHGGAGEDQAGPWSQNLLSAIDLAKKRKAKVISFSGFNGGPIEEKSDICITIPLNMEPYASPIIESCHCIIYHLITIMLKIKISNYKS